MKSTFRLLHACLSEFLYEDLMQSCTFAPVTIADKLLCVLL